MGYTCAMKHLCKYLSILSLIVGLVLFVGGDEKYFHKSGGVGLVILTVGSLFFAILHLFISRQKTALSYHINTLTKLGVGMVSASALIIVIGFNIASGFEGIGVAMIGYPLAFIGIVITVISLFRK
jgi:hypothetical protein